MTNALQLELQGALYYDPSTGIFTWKIRPSQATKVGDVAGGLNAEGYRYIRVLGAQHKASRLAWLYVHGQWPTGFVDHINCQKGDDRIANLRCCDNAENCQNRISPKGAYRTSGGRFTSFITTNGRRRCLGRYDTEQEARDAYLAAKASLHPFSIQGNLNP